MEWCFLRMAVSFFRTGANSCFSFSSLVSIRNCVHKYLLVSICFTQHSVKCQHPTPTNSNKKGEIGMNLEFWIWSTQICYQNSPTAFSVSSSAFWCWCSVQIEMSFSLLRWGWGSMIILYHPNLTKC
jgi:hypothetical protein